MTTINESSSALTGSDLISRFLAATPSYLYNVPPMQHNFFFSEMLRSFVQSKTEPATFCNSSAHRRKRAWRDSNNQPLELTTKEKSRNSRHHFAHYHSHYRTQLQINAQGEQQQQQQQQRLLFQQTNQFETDNQPPDATQETSHDGPVVKQENSARASDDLHASRYFIRRILADSADEDRLSSPDEASVGQHHQQQQQENETDSSGGDDKFPKFCGKTSPDAQASKSKHDPVAPPRSAYGSADGFQSISNLGLQYNNRLSNLLPYASGFSPRLLGDGYPVVDPFKFFIDLHVAERIWDRKCSEGLIFGSKVKHNSAFSVPQHREYNRPLNLTRSKPGLGKHASGNAKGTHYIFKNIKQLYKRVSEAGCLSKAEALKEDFDKIAYYAKENAATTNLYHQDVR